VTDQIDLLEPLIPSLRRYARGLLRDPGEADDLVQDCLERALSHWGKRRTDGDARRWVFTILHNLAMTELKRRGRGLRHVEIDPDDPRLSIPAPQEQRMDYLAVMRGLDALPDEQRAVLLLVSIEDLSYADAAKVLNIPIGTVMSRLARAREKLLTGMSGAPPVSGRTAQLRRVK
jgi:RNA polymerase sigma-70 factor, ECF subfamily